jgi:hypothetical protein
MIVNNILKYNAINNVKYVQINNQQVDTIKMTYLQT